ncbi:MAG TPA: hypothetical protein PKD26_15990 [Pyrinomonadaceae bacterium]|nr:hypothetical protein [Pyrinomonadaceae bacterium]
MFIISKFALGLFTIVLIAAANFACSVAETKTGAGTGPAGPKSGSNTESAGKVASITIEPNGPADIVRIFYTKLRERRFREAIYLTNLRPAVEGLSDDELKEFEVDLAAVARHVPSDILINGEIITGDSATVTAKLPHEDLERPELQEINLRKENGQWIILSVDEYAERRIKEAGKDYLRMLRIETHQDEAKKMLDRIAKAQMAHAAQYSGRFAELRKLVDDGLVPADVLSTESTGYSYVVTLTDNASKYYAVATPAKYGKSGLMSFIVRLDEKNSPLLSSKDTGGKPMQN